MDQFLSKYEIPLKNNRFQLGVFGDHLYKWQEKFLKNEFDHDHQIYLFCKARQSGVTSLFYFLQYYLFLRYRQNLKFYSHTLKSGEPRSVFRNNISECVDLVNNNKRKIKSTYGHQIVFDTLKKKMVLKIDQTDMNLRKTHTLFIDDILSNKKEILERAIYWVKKLKSRKLFINFTIHHSNLKNEIKFINHVNKLPVNIKRYFINSEDRLSFDHANLGLMNFTQYAPSSVIKVFKEEYTSNFEVL